MSSTVHANSTTGFRKGTNELYNQARARYQPEALSHLRQAIKSDGPLNIVEIGSGTGLFTRALLAHPAWTAVQKLKAVDPNEGMRETFAKYTVDDRVVVSEGTFDSTGVESGWADLVIIAHAFHWCLDYEAAAAEFARVLKPEGVFALIWNHEDRDAAKWLDQVRERVERDEKGSPHWRTGLWRQIFEAPSYTKYFLHPEEQTFRYEIPGTTEGIVSRGLSSSRITVLAESEKEEFVKDVEAIMERGESKVWIEEDKTFIYPHRTDLVISRRKAL
ncbi:S-adenosyl-L-methionine-dependent methyltransferase [Mycena maculata]|uniref:S-adenosyl-L-methionine-dependent methyltransferase n=1 Tax=Mycena maculata TaxID=230809 RepID=A0AAD7IU30_9AGAR|nr:S-adenosyl-L-methionine-dependent methyltransferase [Mycena maculata]